MTERTAKARVKERADESAAHRERRVAEGIDTGQEGDQPALCDQPLDRACGKPASEQLGSVDYTSLDRRQPSNPSQGVA
jgi:hypothetical protein